MSKIRIINPSQQTQSIWWDNIDRQSGLTRIKKAISDVNSSSPSSRRTSIANIYTWLMMSCWGRNLDSFGNQEREKFADQVLRVCPNAIRVISGKGRYVLRLMGHEIEFGSVLGVSAFFPLRVQWVEQLIAGKISLYSLTTNNIAMPNNGTYNRDDTFLLANVIIRLAVVDRFLTQQSGMSHERLINKSKLDLHNRVAIEVGFVRHLASFLGDVRLQRKKKRGFVAAYRYVGGMKEFGQIPRLISPQTGNGMMDQFLPKFGFERYGFTKDNDKIFIADLNLVRRPGSGGIEKFLNKLNEARKL